MTSGSFFFKDSDTIETVMTKMRNGTAGVNVFFDEYHKALVVTRKETGTFNKVKEQVDEDPNSSNRADNIASTETGIEQGFKDIQFDGALFQTVFGLNDDNVQNGNNAQFTINGVETERRSNTFTVSGMTITLKDVSEQAITLVQRLMLTLFMIQFPLL